MPSSVCPNIKHRFIRHIASIEPIKHALKSAGVPSTLELTGLLRRDGRRLDGLTLVPWSLEKRVAWDVTCVGRMASSNIRHGILPGADAATEAESRKQSHYVDLPSSVRFEPIAIKTLGGIRISSLAFLKEVVLRMQEGNS